MIAAPGSVGESGRTRRRRTRRVAALGIVVASVALAPSIFERPPSAPRHTAVATAAAPATGSATSTYTVRSGDHLYGIARATGTEFATLLTLNGLSVRSLILPGQVLRVAGQADAEVTPGPSWSGATYTVRSGDHLYGIARATGTEFATLLTLNGLSVRSLILPGQVLRVAGQADAEVTPGPSWSGATYTVRSGDHLYGIARATGTEFATLLTLNGLSVRSLILPGQVLRVAGRGGTVAGPVGGGATYTVVSGDCWSCIARKLGVTMSDLLRVNGARASTTIHPGDVIDLPPGAAVDSADDPPPAPVSDPWLTARLAAVVGTSRIALAESLAGATVRIVWDETVPFGTEAVTERTLTIRVHPRLRLRDGKLDTVLAHEFGHVMALAATSSGAIDDPDACHEKVADELATRLRGFEVRAHPTALCSWADARLIADAVFAQGY